MRAIVNPIEDRGCYYADVRDESYNVDLGDCVKYGLDLRDICSGSYSPETGWVQDKNEALEKFTDLVKFNRHYTIMWSSYREAYEATVSRDGDEISVSVWYGECDEGEDLVYDAVPDGEELSEEEVDQAYYEWLDVTDTIYECTESADLPADATPDDILNKVNELLGSAADAVDESFRQMQAIVKNIIDNRKGKTS